MDFVTEEKINIISESGIAITALQTEIMDDFEKKNSIPRYLRKTKFYSIIEQIKKQYLKTFEKRIILKNNGNFITLLNLLTKDKRLDICSNFLMEFLKIMVIINII